MLKLLCVAVGEGWSFSVTVAESDTVGLLKDKIRSIKKYPFASVAMELYRVKGLSQDMHGHFHLHGTAVAMTTTRSLDAFDHDKTWMRPGSLISTMFDAADVAVPGTIHVLVQLPRPAWTGAATCPQVYVSELLRANPVPDNLEFVQAMDLPLGFKIPVNKPTFTSAWPDEFCFGEAEYRSSLSAFLEHACVGTGIWAAMAMDSLWLDVFQRVSWSCIHHDDSDPSSSHGLGQTDVVITKEGAMVGKVVATDVKTETAFTTIDLTANLPAAAYNKFPRDRQSIPAWTTSTTCIELFELTFAPWSKTFRTRHVTKYWVHDERGRVEFIVDLFKIIKWAFAVQKPNAWEPLIPGIRTRTPNGHYVRWVKAGLVKEFRENATEIDMALIQRIYDANLSHVERGWCKGNTVTITSVGQAVRYAKLSHAVILAHVRAALDELHGIDVAHCDVRADNLFVLEDKRVVLGDLEYCRPVDAAPPSVRCFPKDKPCKTAVELDEYQFRVLSDELATMGI